MRDIKDVKNGRHIPAIIIMDAFSRMCYVNTMRNVKSSSTVAELHKAFDFFGGKPLKITADRGLINTLNHYNNNY